MRAELPPGTPVEVWFQDEMRVGQKNKLTYRWARKGSRSPGHSRSNVPNPSNNTTVEQVLGLEGEREKLNYSIYDGFDASMGLCFGTSSSWKHSSDTLWLRWRRRA